MNSLRNGRDSLLGQIENDFKDPEDGFWEKKQLSIVILKYTRNSRPVLHVNAHHLWHLVYSGPNVNSIILQRFR